MALTHAITAWSEPGITSGSCRSHRAVPAEATIQDSDVATYVAARPGGLIERREQRRANDAA